MSVRRISEGVLRLGRRGFPSTSPRVKEPSPQRLFVKKKSQSPQLTAHCAKVVWHPKATPAIPGPAPLSSKRSSTSTTASYPASPRPNALTSASTPVPAATATRSTPTKFPTRNCSPPSSPSTPATSSSSWHPRKTSQASTSRLGGRSVATPRVSNRLRLSG